MTRELERMQEELASVKWQLEVETSFGALAVKERDYERVRNERLTNELNRLRRELAAARLSKEDTCPT